MLTIKQLYIHPVKSLAGFSVDSFSLDSTGPEYDRRWMIVDANGKFVTQRQRPKMCLIKTRIDDDVLTLSADNRISYKVPSATNDFR